MTILTFRHIQCLHLMYAEVAWVLVSSRTQVQPQVTFDPDYLPDYLSFLMTVQVSMAAAANSDFSLLIKQAFLGSGLRLRFRLAISKPGM